MGTFELILVAVGLAMDAFAVAVCKGLSIKKISLKNSSVVGLWFGGFQALMPLIGYMLGKNFEKYITHVDHWVAFGLLVLIGLNMMREFFTGEESEPVDGSISVKSMLPAAIATSIDALAVGVTFAFLSVNIVLAVVLIGVITMALSMAGVKIGSMFGTKFQKNAEMLGGIILICMGLKILLEHLGVL